MKDKKMIIFSEIGILILSSKPQLHISTYDAQMTSSFVDTLLYSIVLETSVLVRAIEGLHRQGYTDQFSLFDDKIVSRATGKIFYSGELIVDDILCCDDEGCEGFKIYVVRDPKDELKGILTILLPPPAEQPHEAAV